MRRHRGESSRRCACAFAGTLWLARMSFSTSRTSRAPSPMQIVAIRSPAARRPIGSRPWNATYRTRRRTPRRPLLGVRAPRVFLQLHATPSDQTSRPPSEPTTRHSSSPLQLRPQFVEEVLHHHERWRSRHVLPLVVSHHEKPPIVRRDRKRAPDRRSRAESVWDREQDLR
jgi:hypothetical protein